MDCQCERLYVCEAGKCALTKTNTAPASTCLDPIIISLAARSRNQLTCQLLLQRGSRVEEEKDNEIHWRPHRRVCALLNDLESKKMFIGSNHQISNGLLHFFFLRLIFPSVFLERNLFFRQFPRYFLISFDSY